MSRIRSVHPGLWTDERFVSVEPMARLFFMGIWNECDDQGYFEWSPLKLKMRLLPADNADAGALLTALEAAGCVMRYSVAGRTFGVVRNFTKYQRPKKPNAVYPETEEAKAFAAGSGEPVPNQLPTASEIAPQMEEGEKEEVPPVAPRKRRAATDKSKIPEDWVAPPIAELTPKALECAAKWTKASYDTVAEGFACYWKRTGRMNRDWRLTWCEWVIREHSKVMRDQKFGNAPTDSPTKRDLTAEDYEEIAKGHRRIGREDAAQEALRMAAKMRSSIAKDDNRKFATGPPGQPIGGVATRIAGRLDIQH